MKGLNGRLRPVTGREGGQIVERLKNSRRSAAAFVLIIAGVVSALAGSAGMGNAAPGITFTFEPLIGTSTINEIPKVSYGKGIGFHLLMQNGTNSAPHSSMIVVTNNDATYDSSTATFNGTTTSCDARPGSDGHVMECLLPPTLEQGDTFEAFFRFIAPSLTTPPITQVTTTATLSIAAQTVGGNKNKGTTLASGVLKTDLTSQVTTDNAYLKHDETASTAGAFTSTHPQNFTLHTPAGLLSGAFGVAVGITDRVETPANPCVGELNSCTTLTIPAAKFAESQPGTPFPGNPFYDGHAVAPYIWNMDATYTGGFSLTGVLHAEDNQSVPDLVPSCASLVTTGNPTGNPTAANPLCYDHLTQDNPNKLLHADGRGIENGGLGFT
jgi:hypothetical protein